MLDVTVIVATYGHTRWKHLARSRAIPSVPDGVPVTHVHGETLADARNRAAAQAETEWLCFLDADDELEPRYFSLPGIADVIVPRVRYVENGVAGEFAWLGVSGHDHECRPDCLADGNYIVIGAPVRRSLFEAVGGFRELPVYEDYDLWYRCWRAGARIVKANTVYRAHVNPAGRNHGLTAAERRAVQDAIAA